MFGVVASTLFTSIQQWKSRINNSHRACSLHCSADQRIILTSLKKAESFSVQSILSFIR